jgi:TPP-dependent pyruvate/acetoin dehydrogenase alpha subunit
LAQWKARDPLILLGKRLRKNQIREIEIKVDHEIEAAVLFAKNSPEPSVRTFLEEIDND